MIERPNRQVLQTLLNLQNNVGYDELMKFLNSCLAMESKMVIHSRGDALSTAVGQGRCCMLEEVIDFLKEAPSTVSQPKGNSI